MQISNHDVSSRVLCVAIRGWTDGDEFWVRLLKQQGGDLPKAFITAVENIPGLTRLAPVPNLDMSLFSAAEPDDLAEHILNEIDKEFEAGTYDRVVLLAYSSGAPLARFALMKAYQSKNDPDCEKSHKWIDPNVSIRVVYLAGIVRGWSISTAMPAGIRFWAPVLIRACNMVARLKGKKRSFIAALRKGESFIVRGRLMQAELRKQSEDLYLPFEQVSVLGTKDEFIAPTDCIELTGDRRQIFFQVPGTSHL